MSNQRQIYFMTEHLPRYQMLYRRAADLNLKKQHLRHHQEITSQALDSLHPFQPNNSKSKKLNFQSFFKRNLRWTSKTKSRRMLRSMSRDRESKQEFDKMCSFQPEVHPSPRLSSRSSRSIKGVKDYITRQVRAKVKKQEKSFLLDHPHAHVWNATERFDSSIDELNLELKVQPRARTPTAKHRSGSRWATSDTANEQVQALVGQLLSPKVLSQLDQEE